MNFLINSQWISTIVGATVGSILTLITTIVWDNHKNKKKYESLLKLLLSELKENQKRVNSVVEKLPKNIRDGIKNGVLDLNEKIFFPEAEINKLGWTFPKPYTVDAWKTFILSGYAAQLESELFQKLYKIYDSIDSINFLSNLSVSLFQIISQPNKLDSETNKNFDQFCRFGTLSLQAILFGNIDAAKKELEAKLKLGEKTR